MSSNVLTVKIEADTPVSTGSPGASSGRPGEEFTPWEQRATSGLIDQRRKAMEAQRKAEEQAEAKRLKDIIEGQKILADLRAKRQKAEEEAERRQIEATQRRAADVIRQREEWQQQQGGLQGLLARVFPGASRRGFPALRTQARVGSLHPPSTAVNFASGLGLLVAFGTKPSSATRLIGAAQTTKPGLREYIRGSI